MVSKKKKNLEYNFIKSGDNVDTSVLFKFVCKTLLTMGTATKQIYKNIQSLVVNFKH